MKRFGFIGLGNMGGAIAGGLAKTKSFELIGFDPSEVMRARQAGIMTILPSGQDVARQADLLLLAVKPQVMRHVLTDLAQSLKPGTCLISIAAGIPWKCSSSGPARAAPLCESCPTPRPWSERGIRPLL